MNNKIMMVTRKTSHFSICFECSSITHEGSQRFHNLIITSWGCTATGIPEYWTCYRYWDVGASFCIGASSTAWCLRETKKINVICWWNSSSQTNNFVHGLYKLGQSIQKRWGELKEFKLLAESIRGVQFKDGERLNHWANWTGQSFEDVFSSTRIDRKFKH